MKRLWALIAAIGMMFCTAALASEGHLVDSAPYTDFYGCATTAEGNVIVALGLRDESNRTEGQHRQKARLACLDLDGKLLWEVIGEQGDNAYAGVSVLSDGTVLALYVDRTQPAGERYARCFLHTFSPTGERIGETALPDDYLQSKESAAGMLVTIIGRNPSDSTRRVTLYGGTLTPVWTLEGFAFFHRYDSASVAGEDMVLLHRDTKGRGTEPVDQVRLTRIDSGGQERWSRVLSEQQMGYMDLQTDPDGNCVVYMNNWVDSVNGKGQSADGTLLCFDPDGNERWQKPLRFPEKDGQYELVDFRLLEDGYLFMGLAKTDTRVRLYRFDAAGALVGHTDHFLEEEAYHRGPEMAGPLDDLRVLVMQVVEDRQFLWMMPLEMPQ